LNEQSEDDFAIVNLKSQDARDLAVGHLSLSVFVSKSQYGIAELNENG
jgi:hypothetical protein